MKALGRHFIVDLYGCDRKSLDSVQNVQDAMIKASQLAKVHIVAQKFHKFNPWGVSGVVVIAESHLSIHTWPEFNYAAVDTFTCGKTLKPEKACSYLRQAFKAKNWTVMEIKRGMIPLKKPARKCKKENGIMKF